MIRRRRFADLAAGDRRRVIIVLALVAGAALGDALLRGAGRVPITPTVDAGIFHAIWVGITVLADWLGAAASVSAAYLASALSWLASRVAHFLVSSGAMFAKLWDGMKIVWKDVLRPAIKWVDTHIRNLHTWLVKTFKPVFKFLNDVRGRLQDFYKRFVRPVLDTIDFIRAINRVLHVFHVHLLDDLDRILANIERKVDGYFAWAQQQITKVENALDAIVGMGGLFQKWILVASLNRYAPTWIKNFWSVQAPATVDPSVSARRAASYPGRPPADDRDALIAYLDAGAGDKAGIILELGDQMMQIAEAIAPTTDDTRAVDELLSV